MRVAELFERSMHIASTVQLITALCALLATQAASQGIASGVLLPVAREKASDLLPVSEASFQELRVTNAELRASNANLEPANSKNVAVLGAAEAKLLELHPGLPGINGIDASDGPRGPTGSSGQDSITGSTGFSGETAGAGQAGLLGDTGLRGYGGATGQSGLSGKNGATGFLGLLGTTGDTGVQAKGSSGLSGLLGMTRYLGITGATGITNMQGLQGGQGFTGASGNGNSGVTANTGTTGEASATGSAALTGGSGVSGASGNTGNSGSAACIMDPVTLNFDDIFTSGGLAYEGYPYTYRGLTVGSLPGSPAGISLYIVSQTKYGGSYGVHSSPNYLALQNILYGDGAVPLSSGITLMDSSGATFGLLSFYLDGAVFSGCSETVTISGTTAGGTPNLACSAVISFPVPGEAPVKVLFDPPCFATTISIYGTLDTPGCYFGDSALQITLDDITLCPTSSTSLIL